MGGFAAEFRGFWVGYGRGEAIQRTADTAGRSGRKNFLKRAEKSKNWGPRGAGRWFGSTLYRVRGVFLGLEAGPLAAMLGVHFVQVPQPQASATRFQRFIPIYRESLFMSSIARLMKVSPLVRSVIFQPSPVA